MRARCQDAVERREEAGQVLDVVQRQGAVSRIEGGFGQVEPFQVGDRILAQSRSC